MFKYWGPYREHLKMLKPCEDAEELHFNSQGLPEPQKHTFSRTVYQGIILKNPKKSRFLRV